MRKHSTNGKISVHVIAGTEVVLLGLNATKEAAKGLLGFAIRRYDSQSRRSYWLRGGTRRFKELEAIDSSEGKEIAQSSRTAPIQAFLWGDYAADPGCTYTYTVVPIYGKPGALKQGDSVKVKITTESEEDKKHAIFFNRGVAGSQAYSRMFGDYRKYYPVEKYGRVSWREFTKPDNVPDRKAWKWLSRGLEEAILSFIAQANGPEYGLRAAIYELDYLPVIQAFADALESGADVKIIRHAKRKTRTEVRKGKEVKVEYLDEVAQTAKDAIQQMGIKEWRNVKRWEQAFIERTDTTISHNKFIVDGIIHPSEVQLFKTIKGFYLIGITADLDIRVKEAIRWYEYDLPNANKSDDDYDSKLFEHVKGIICERDQFEGFAPYEEGEEKIEYLRNLPHPNVIECLELADYVINIESSMEENNLFLPIDTIIKSLIKQHQ